MKEKIPDPISPIAPMEIVNSDSTTNHEKPCILGKTFRPEEACLLSTDLFCMEEKF